MDMRMALAGMNIKSAAILLLCLCMPVLLAACASKYVTVRGVVERIEPKAIMNATVITVRAEYDHVYKVSVTPCPQAETCDDKAAALVGKLNTYDEIEFKAFYESKSGNYVVARPGYIKKLNVASNR